MTILTLSKPEKNWYLVYDPKEDELYNLPSSSIMFKS